MRGRLPVTVDNSESAERDGCIYLHKFLASDWSRDLHDHPKRFVSIGLWGGYVEERLVRHPYHHLGDSRSWRDRRQYKAPWIRTFPANHIHRVRVTPKGCWTLVLVGGTTREWGFWVTPFKWMHNRPYRAMFGGDEKC